MAYFRCGSGNSSSDTSNLLFKDGQWYNQDAIEITAVNSTIVGGNLQLNGSLGIVAGIVVSDAPNLTENNYFIEVTYDFTNTSGGPLQYGRCIPTNDLDSILRYGTNRIDYQNYTVTSNDNSFELVVMSAVSNGIFAGMECTGIITEIRFVESNVLAVL